MWEKCGHGGEPMTYENQHVIIYIIANIYYILIPTTIMVVFSFKRGRSLVWNAYFSLL